MTKSKLVNYFLSNPNLIGRAISDFINGKRGDKKMFEHEDYNSVSLAMKEARTIRGGNKEGANDVNFKKSKSEDGSFTSEITLDFEPKSEKELYSLHKVDETIFEIRSFWSKLKAGGKFTSSVFCVRRKVESDPLALGTLTAAVLQAVKKSGPLKRLPRQKINRTSNELIVAISDEHVAAQIKSTDLFDSPYGAKEYERRLTQVLDQIHTEVELNQGEFTAIHVVKLGDNMDGFNAATCRPNTNVRLPQNMTNAECITTYSEANIRFWDALVDGNYAAKLNCITMENSNHSGNGWDFAGNLVVKTYLNAAYPLIDTIQEQKFIKAFNTKNATIVLTHGKDESYMKHGFPYMIDEKTETIVKQFLESQKNLKVKEKVLLLKGDLHRFGISTGKFFDYVNVGSLFGASGWVMANFGNTKPSFSTVVISETMDPIIKNIKIKL